MGYVFLVIGFIRMKNTDIRKNTPFANRHRHDTNTTKIQA